MQKCRCNTNNFLQSHKLCICADCNGKVGTVLLRTGNRSIVRIDKHTAIMIENGVINAKIFYSNSTYCVLFENAYYRFQSFFDATSFAINY